MYSDSFLSTIPLSDSDRLLHSWGYDLTKEYAFIMSRVQTVSSIAVELATGTGRMCAVLSGLFPTVITGDSSLNDHARAVARIPSPHLSRVKFVQLNMESLPFRTNSIPLLFCLNTLHEAAEPEQCLHEMIRVIRPDGMLVIGDFNRTGFDAMQEIHRIEYTNDHSEGKIDIERVREVILEAFKSLEDVPTPLNTTFIASQKNT